MIEYRIEEDFYQELGSSLDTLISNEKKNLLSNLSGDANDLADFEKELQSFKQKEIWFYNLVLSKLNEYVGETPESRPIYLFFDIDETIAHKDMQWRDVIRPSLKFLLSTLKEQYPTIHFAICSARGEEYVQQFITDHPEYAFEVWYSSRKLSSDLLDVSWGKDLTMGHYNKARAMIDITDKYPSSYCILVDDSIGFPFEEKKMWIPISSVAFYGYPEARWLM